MQLELPIDSAPVSKEIRVWVLAQDLSSYVPLKSQRLFLDPEDGSQPFALTDILLIKASEQAYHLYAPSEQVAVKNGLERERFLQNVSLELPRARKMVTEVQDFLSIAVAPGKARACGVFSSDPISEVRTVFEDLLLRRFLVAEESGLKLLGLVNRAQAFLVERTHPGAQATLSEVCAYVLIQRWRGSNDERFLSWAEEYVSSARESFLASSMSHQADIAKRNVDELNRMIRQPTLPGLEPKPLKYARPGLNLQRVSGFPLQLASESELGNLTHLSNRGKTSGACSYEYCGELVLSDQLLLNLLSETKDQYTRICVTASPHRNGFMVRVGAFDEFSVFAWAGQGIPINSVSRNARIECKTLRVSTSVKQTTGGDVYVLEKVDRRPEHRVIAQTEIPGEGTAELAFTLPSALTSTAVFL